MRIDRLEWDNYRVEHVERHNVEADEVQEVCDALDTSRAPRDKIDIDFMAKHEMGLLVPSSGADQRCDLQAYHRPRDD